MEHNIRMELEEYIEDWYDDKESYETAYKIGKFLFSFFRYVEDQNRSFRVDERHAENIYLIGVFEAEYGRNHGFDGGALETFETYEDEYVRRISSAKTAIQSYLSTWNKLQKYLRSKSYEEYLESLNEEIDDLGWVNIIFEFIIAIKLLKIEDKKTKEVLYKKVKIIEENYVELEDCKSKQAFNECMLKAWKETELVCEIVESKIDGELKNKIIKKGRKLSTGFYELVNN
jgi:hypothetical protein